MSAQRRPSTSPRRMPVIAASQIAGPVGHGDVRELAELVFVSSSAARARRRDTEDPSAGRRCDTRGRLVRRRRALCAGSGARSIRFGCERAAVVAATAPKVGVEVFEVGDGETAEWHSTDVREHVAVDHFSYRKAVVGRSRSWRIGIHLVQGIWTP